MSRWSRAMRCGRGAGIPGLLVLALGVVGLPSRVSAAEQNQAAEQGQAAEQRPSPGRHAATRHPRGSGLDDRVAKLTRALHLDSKQQVGLRKVLQHQREQVLRVWSDGSVPSADRIVATKAVSRQTRQQIRALLNEEQRKMYDPPPQEGADRVVGNAHVEDWMKGGTTQ